jgi:hypothetical protein
LGEDLDDLAQLAREDQTRHEEAINEHHRTTLTIRGFAITAVAALIAAIFVSRSVIPAIAAMLLSAYFCFVDFYYSRLYTQVSGRLRVLERLSRRYRGLLARRHRRPAQLQKMRADLLTYSSGPAIPRTPRLRPVRPLDKSFAVFLGLYFGLALAALAGGVYAVCTEESDSPPVVVHCLNASAVIVGAPCSADRNSIRARPDRHERAEREPEGG